MTKGIDASDDTGIDTLFDEEVRLIADVTKLSTPNRSVYNPDQDVFFLDLQTAIDDADPGDTIQVLEGTSFNTNLTITKPITLVATSNTKPVIVADPTVDTSAIKIDGVDDVTIDDFRITFDGTQSPNGEKYGIRALADSNRLTVRNCIIGGFRTRRRYRTTPPTLTPNRAVPVAGPDGPRAAVSAVRTWCRHRTVYLGWTTSLQSGHSE